VFWLRENTIKISVLCFRIICITHVKQDVKKLAINGSNQLVQKLWNYCTVLRDDGLSYGDYVQQLTNLLFLKMTHERTLPPWNQPSVVPEGYDWPSLIKLDGAELETHYRIILEELGKKGGMLGAIFRKSQNRIQDPAKLRRLIVDLIDQEQWSSIATDVKGDAYEGLLEKNAQDTKSGAGQYFTPRPLIKAIVDVMCPRPDTTICDPACGTGGFLLAAHEYISKNYDLDRDQKEFLRFNALHGWEIVDNTARLCAMNFLLHGVGGDEESPIHVEDALASDPGMRFDMVLTNPPFGKKSSITIISGDDVQKETISYVRDDFWVTTSNKQLNFLQHVKTLLKEHGHAAVVVPDNVLFEGGAGETIRRRLLHECDVHTLLRLPTGIFYAQGVKANVLFFDRKPGSEKPWTKELWIYDLRTNMNFTLKTNPLERKDLDEFVECYNPENRFSRKETWNEENPTGRWRSFLYDDLIQRDKVNLDIFWLRDDSLEDSANLPSPDVLAAEIAEDLQSALEQFSLIAEDLGDIAEEV
jgi:type I restriction enzyme M protein